MQHSQRAALLFETIALPYWLIGATILTIAYLVRGIAGFGSGLIAIPLLALYVPLTLVVPLVVFLDYVASASHGLKDRLHVQWKELRPLLPFSVIGVVAGIYLFKTIDAVLLANGLGLFVIFYALYTLFNNKESGGATSSLWAAPIGLLGGLIGTMFGTGGPFYVVYLKHRGLSKTEFRATFATIFLLDGAVRLIGYLSSGYFNTEWLMLTAVALPIMAIGLYIGGHIHTRISARTFQVAISLLVIGSGISLLLRP